MTAEVEEIKKKPKVKDEFNEGEDTNTNSIKRSHDGEENIAKKKKKHKKNKKNKSESSEVMDTSVNEDETVAEGNEVQKDEENKESKKKPKKEKIKKKKSGETEEEKATEENEDGEDGEVKKKKEPSKRELKRQKAELRAAEAKEVSRNENAQRALNYISKWKHAKSEWKFEKLRQVWLIDNLLNETYIPDEHFPTVIEYFEGCKGVAKKQLMDKAMAVIKKVEESIEEDEELAEKTEYKRARHLLQALPSEV